MNASLRPIALYPMPHVPLASILISNYNYGAYLSDALKSCLDQTYGNFEVIVCDDGSTDASREILEQYRMLDPRIKVLYQGNGGQSQALNAAFSESAGEILCLLDADDVFLRDKLQLVVNALATAPTCGFAVNRMSLVDKARKYQAEIPSLYQIPTGWRGGSLSLSGPQVLPGLPPTSGISLRRPVAEAIFPLPARLKAYSDTLILVLAPMMTCIAAIETPASEYRLHGANVGGVTRFTEDRVQNLAKYEQEIWSAWRRYVKSPRSGLPSNFPLPSNAGTSLMDYVCARFRSNRNFKAVYRNIPPASLQTLPKLHQLYWRVSLMLPNQLFQRSFDFVYGQPRLKMIARRIFSACRKSLWRRGTERNSRTAR